ncbi:MAG TPA: hypothetical protein DEA50_01365 [Parvularcula sp.]|nr:hypothetical protein [Parvularcula sp.]
MAFSYFQVAAQHRGALRAPQPPFRPRTGGGGRERGIVNEPSDMGGVDERDDLRRGDFLRGAGVGANVDFDHRRDGRASLL